MAAPRKFSRSELPAVKRMLIQEQGGVCPICGKSLLHVKDEFIVVDHDHETGSVRGALHRGCNRLEGVAMKAAISYGKGVGKIAHVKVIENLVKYWKSHMRDKYGLIYYLHKTDEEKRLARNKKARLARAKKKKLTTKS